MRTLPTITCLIIERMPLGYNDCENRVALRLAKEFTSLRGMLEEAEVDDLEALCREVVEWVRSRGYQLCD